MKIILTSFILFTSYFTTTTLAAEEQATLIETDWLEPKVGSTGKLIDAKVSLVESDANNNVTVIEVTVPIKNPEDIESITVIDKKNKQPIKQTKDAEWLKKYDQGQYGLRLHLKRMPNFEFRIQLETNEDAQ